MFQRRTALAFVIYFRLIQTLGSVGTTAQAYLRVPIGVALGEPQNGALFNRLRGAVVCRAEHEFAQRLAAKICGALQKRLDVRREARVEGRAAILFMRFCG